MLQKKTVPPDTLELITTLQKEPYLRGFHLAGGTALALRLGHRTSVDIDLFSLKGFHVPDLLHHLEKKYGFRMSFQDKNTLKGTIHGVFVDILMHDYPLVKEIIEEEGIRLYSLEDIAAMKINAICLDGTRIKDFIDICFLLDIFSVREILSFYKKKYGLRSDLHALKSLGYFGDLPEDPEWPEMVKEKDLTMEKIKDKITMALKKYLDPSAGFPATR